MQEENKLAIIVVSCDKYSDLWDDVFNLKERFWPDCPYKTFLATDTKDYKREDVTVLHFGNIREWMICTRKAVEKINSEYILFLMEDYFFVDRVDNNRIKEILSLMEEEHGDFINMHHRPPYLKQEDVIFDKCGVIDIPRHTRYGIDTTGAIWNRQFFLEQLNREDGNAWQFEAMLVKDAATTEGLPGRIFYDTEDSLHLCKKEVVRLGKFTLDAVKEIEGLGYKIVSTRPRMTKVEFYKDKLKGRLSSIKVGRKFLKKIGRKLGFVFFTEE